MPKRVARLGALPALLIAGLGAVAYAQGYTGVVITANCDVYDSDNRCVDNPTPAQRAAQDERNRRDQERLARERAEREAREVDFRRQVDAQVATMGESRRAEAERFVRMRQEAEAARPKPTAANTCTMIRIGAGYSSAWLDTEAKARDAVSKWSAVACNRGDIACGATTCQREDFSLPFQPRNIPRDIRYQCGIEATRPYRSCPSHAATVTGQ